MPLKKVTILISKDFINSLTQHHSNTTRNRYVMPAGKDFPTEEKHGKLNIKTILRANVTVTLCFSLHLPLLLTRFIGSLSYGMLLPGIFSVLFSHTLTDRPVDISVTGNWVSPVTSGTIIRLDNVVECLWGDDTCWVGIRFFSCWNPEFEQFQILKIIHSEISKASTHNSSLIAGSH